jgi:hypothetical protein
MTYVKAIGCVFGILSCIGLTLFGFAMTAAACFFENFTLWAVVVHSLMLVAGLGLSSVSIVGMWAQMQRFDGGE